MNQLVSSDIKLKSFLLLKKFSESLNTYAQTDENMLKKILDIYLIMKMNDFEFTFWVLILEKFLADNTIQSIQKLIKYCAYAAKALTNTDIGLLDTELEEKYPGFYIKSHKWIKKYQKYTLSTPQDINKKYNELSLSIQYENKDFYINYGKIVEELVINWVKVKEHAQSLRPENIDI
ncbi:hypothetical protein SteCoe_12666 [Stentor coeruleus]|uniref:Uncharacterized protein n=1 Tax=Stentor coeruleus TaxID=5963 RepID=A0A1R2CA67_9CILI|nr:hypothetical protein SteCoe_12666 [Stentor coeruleus]